MVDVKDIILTGQTVTYNDVQIGGKTAAGVQTQMMPPQFSLTGTHVYDEANRAVTHIAHTLTVSTTVFQSDEGLLSRKIDVIREKLSRPNKILQIAGLGLGYSAKNPADIIWGPLPKRLDFTPLGGGIATQMNWVIDFNVAVCDQSTGSASLSKLMALNFDTITTYDPEGLAIRQINGYVQFPSGALNLRQLPDQLRHVITVKIPHNFKRNGSRFTENKAKNRLQFNFVDQELKGDAPPPGCTVFNDSTEMTQGEGFQEGQMTFSADIITRPREPAATGGTQFMIAALKKQANMQKGVGIKNAVIPTSIRIRTSRANRTTQASMSWLVTGCLQDVLKDGGLWEPFVNPVTGYTQWRASMETLWGSGGLSNLSNIPSDDIIVDLCGDTTSHQITGGVAQAGPINEIGANLKCQPIPEDSSWLAQELDVRLIRNDEKIVHRKALKPEYGVDDLVLLDRAGSSSSTIARKGKTSTGMPNYTVSRIDDHTVEYSGFPVNAVLLRFKGLRVEHKPVVPSLDNVGGSPVEHIVSQIGTPRAMFNLPCHTVWFVSGWRLYQVNGYVPEMEPQGNPTICKEPDKKQTSNP